MIGEEKVIGLWVSDRKLFIICYIKIMIKKCVIFYVSITNRKSEIKKLYIKVKKQKSKLSMHFNLDYSPAFMFVFAFAFTFAFAFVFAFAFALAFAFAFSFYFVFFFLNQCLLHCSWDMNSKYKPMNNNPHVNSNF